ncbi:hypothetical protein KIW84_040545 [Lathyrus oleraceus]|uniref:Uncharacterized protein n=1 Tax=Pisum sativum TaxID=3888 RepID=A0A9D4XAH8_PEA|nr:hypothetical protein KIW84_040545 [Pisum sativum]
MDTSSSFSSSYDFDRFTSAKHQERYFSLLDKNIIKERILKLHPYEHPYIHDVLKKNKLTYLSSQIKLVAKELVLEFYVNAYRPPTKDDAAVSKKIGVTEFRDGHIRNPTQELDVGWIEEHPKRTTRAEEVPVA